jgi:hypothetical protein
MFLRLLVLVSQSISLHSTYHLSAYSIYLFLKLAYVLKHGVFIPAAVDIYKILYD